MKTRTEFILKIMNVLAWIAFIGLMVKAGAILYSYIVTINNPEAARNFYDGMNFYDLRRYDFGHYTATVLTLVLLEAAKAFVAYLVTRVISKIKMSNPFTIEVSKILEKISYLILGIWVLVVLHNGHLNSIMSQVPGLKLNLISGDFILLAGVIFVFSQIFKKGVEIQSENELTV